MGPGKLQIVGGPQAEVPRASASQQETNGTASQPLAAPGSLSDHQTRSRITLLLLTAVALGLAFVVYRPFLKALFLALVLTIAFLPMHEWISRRVRRNSVAALLTTAVVVFLIMTPLLYISIKLLSEAASLYGAVSQQGSAAWTSRSAWFADAVQRASEQTGLSPAYLRSAVTSRVQEFGGWMLGLAGWAARGFMQQVGTAMLTLVVMFFFVRDREQYRRGIEDLLPLPSGCLQELTGALHDTVIANVYGMVVVGVIQGSLTGFGWWVTGLRAPILWGAIATIFSFIPLVGPSLIWVPGTLILALQGRWVPALFLFVWGAVVVSSVDYIVRPRFAGGRTNANTLLVLLSLLGGLKAFGAIGIIAGPVVLSAVMALLSTVRTEYRGSQVTAPAQSPAAAPNE